MKFSKKYMIQNKKQLVAAIIIIAIVGIVMIPLSYASLEPIQTITITSQNLDYKSRQPGSWQINKSAKWIKEGTAEITFDLDTVFKPAYQYRDILFVVDTSYSMNGNKLDKVKKDAIELINTLSSDDKNQAALITFGTDSQIISGFTNNNDSLIEKINALSARGNTNYYQALVNVETVLKNYKPEKNRKCIIVFLTDGYPNIDIPNQEAQFRYLKYQYPYVVINGVQYEMGNDILEPITKISDNQFHANVTTLKNVLFNAASPTEIYENFIVTDFINTDYFYVENETDIKTSYGTAKLDKEKQKITWKLNGLKSGLNSQLTVNVKLKDEYINQGGVYPTNTQEKIVSTLSEENENITSPLTPIIADNYKVIYEGNAPSDCQIENVPETQRNSVFKKVFYSDYIPKCEGYRFKGWKVVTQNVDKLYEDYFVMPEDDVTLKATWSKLAIKKSMDGTVSTKRYIPFYEQLFENASLGSKGRFDTSDSEQTFITGENPNNYVWYSGKLWRAVSKDTSDDSVKLVTAEEIAELNYDYKNNATFQNSSIKQWLNDTSVDGFLGNLREPDDYIKRNSKWNATKTSSTTKPPKTTMVTDAVGLLNLYEYTMSYKGTTAINGYLTDGLYWWLLTPYSSTAVNVVHIQTAAVTNLDTSTSFVGVRPSINIRSTVNYASGTGTESNPYRLQGDADIPSNGTRLNTRYSGEYVRFGTGENNLYRIVSKENGGTKIVSANPLKSNGSFVMKKYNTAQGKISYAPSDSTYEVAYFLNHDYLNATAGYLTTAQINMITSAPWYFGTVETSQGYKLAKYTSNAATALTANKVNAKVGLLRLGEQLSGQPNRFYTKGQTTMTNLNTSYWAITPQTSTDIACMMNNGSLSRQITTVSRGIRPVINLKSTTKITGGEGTKNNPFTISL